MKAPVKELLKAGSGLVCPKLQIARAVADENQTKLPVIIPVVSIER